MWIRKDRFSRRLAGVAFLCSIFVLTSIYLKAQQADHALEENQIAIPAHQLVVLLDINPHQKNVLPIEQSLAEGVIRKLDQPKNVFTVITFGFQPATLLKSRVNADEAVTAISNITLEPQDNNSNVSYLYDALSLAFAQLADGSKSVLVISEGNDYAKRKTFKQTVLRANYLHVAIYSAVIADHAIYGSKSIQRYGFYLRELAAKTSGQYVEFNGGTKKVARAIDRFSDEILVHRR